ELTRELDGTKKRVELAEKRLSDMEAEWDRFRRGYDAEKREQLAKNLAAAEQMLTRLSQDASSLAANLGELHKIEAEIKSIRDDCARQARDIRDVNQVGQVKDRLQTLAGEITRLESELSSLRLAGSQLSRLESRVSTLGNQFSTLSSQVRTIKINVDTM